MPTENDFGTREDGSIKERGYLGVLRRPDGNYSTEVSIGVVFDDQAVSIPTLVPGLSEEEINQVLRDNMPDSVVDKAVEHARMRIQQGKSPFWNPKDDPEEEEEERPWEDFASSRANSYLNYSEPEIQRGNSEAPWEAFRRKGNTYLDLPETPARQPSRAPTRDEDQFDRVFSRLMQQESRSRHRDAQGNLITSPVGARGITQVMPATGRDPGFGIQPLQDDSEEEYIRFGREYLSAMLNRYDGDYEKALAAYNAGVGNVDKAITRGGGKWKEFLPKRSETLPYIRNILNG